ncbi:MAG TPA: hypothetical protein VHV99_22035 [Paraburkholderia sp.]|nr:hypothetical protein [Paraburkholderia sp.]
MSRIDIPTPDQIPEGSKQILDTMTRQLHLTPNLFKIMALSPNALNGWAGLQGALAKTLDAKTLDLHSARRGHNLARISSLVRRAKGVFRDTE